MWIPEQIEITLDRILPYVSKPGRYTGGEYNQIVKNWNEVDFTVALAFPDTYDLGMSNLGLMIMYDIINGYTNLAAERVYTPWFDMEEQLRKLNMPLHSLETKHPLRDFDLLAISLPYEQLYTNALNLLDLAQYHQLQLVQLALELAQQNKLPAAQNHFWFLQGQYASSP